MSDFKSRLNDEQTQLSEKIEKLEGFTKTDNFKKVDEVQKSLLAVQLAAMKTYEQCLFERIGHITDN